MGTIVLISGLGLFLGLLIGFLIGKLNSNHMLQSEKDVAAHRYSELEKQFIAFKATSTAQEESATERLLAKGKEFESLKEEFKKSNTELQDANDKLSTSNANLNALRETLTDKAQELAQTKEELKALKNGYSAVSEQLATAKAQNNALNDKLATQKEEMEALNKKFTLEFENVANKILETKSERFTELNKSNITALLEPLGKNIDEFKRTVNDTYDKESKERFSLGEKVKELSQLNQQISEEARNLTRALKSEVKTQGRWGEMILESILEKSGLRKDEEYFMEHQLLDEQGNPLRSDSEGKKMRPDAVIKYPDNRSVIIDSKVSLNAFTRYLAATEAEAQKAELNNHVSDIKLHINALSTKGYDDYDKALDFVMMFIPSEPAYIAAMQGAPDLWNYAYEKRILLMNPTNLITSLKLIVDLWKREYQNRNAIEIAERGAKLYDKFVGFVDNLKDVGEHIDKAQIKYSEAYKQLSTGNDNLVLQATKLKDLGVKPKKQLKAELVNQAMGNMLELNDENV